MLPQLAPGSIDCVITSPPYFGKRDYGHADQIGHEPTVQEFVDELVDVVGLTRPLLTPTGVVWVNLADGYDDDGGLELAPQRFAIALDAAGWRVRSDVVWHKPDALPDSGAKGRPGADHEYVFLANPRASSRRHFWDALAVRVAAPWQRWGTQTTPKYGQQAEGTRARVVRARTIAEIEALEGYGWKNLRSTWSIPAARYSGAHYAVFPDRLVEQAIRASCPVGGTVLDPFLGSGTTARVAIALGRRCVGVELNGDEYGEQIRARVAQQLRLQV